MEEERGKSWQTGFLERQKDGGQAHPSAHRLRASSHTGCGECCGDGGGGRCGQRNLCCPPSPLLGSVAGDPFNPRLLFLMPEVCAQVEKMPVAEEQRDGRQADLGAKERRPRPAQAGHVRKEGARPRARSPGKRGSMRGGGEKESSQKNRRVFKDPSFIERILEFLTKNDLVPGRPGRGVG